MTTEDYLNDPIVQRELEEFLKTTEEEERTILENWLNTLDENGNSLV